ncbi:MAG: sugar transferase [Pirellulales bacterium]|nr:sugar transferase [Pirellulales bacterium]
MAVLKRLFDILVAAELLLVFSLPMLLVALAVRFSMGGPVVFRQVRPGRNRRPFTLYKFRTMTDARGPDGELLPDGERLTWLGRFLRKTSLDELPQLWNVLKGEMSLVGPRPLLMRYLPYYTRRESLRFTVPPGITGWSQVHGRNLLAWQQRLELEAWYVEHWSLLLDLKILWLTLIAVFTHRGVVVDPRSTGGKDLDEERMAQPEFLRHARATRV